MGRASTAPGRSPGPERPETAERVRDGCGAALAEELEAVVMEGDGLGWRRRGSTAMAVGIAAKAVGKP
jgi:hypothetical protein